MKVSEWLAANKLSLNVKKSNFLHFHYGKSKKPIINLKLNGIPVDEKKVTKYLGTFIDNKLDWKTHIEYVRAKMSKGTGMISKIRYYVNEACLLNLFYSFIQAHANYNLLNWSSTKYSFLNPIELKFKTAIRLISFKGRYEHTGPLFSKLNILPFRDLIKYKQGNFLWKVCNGYVKPPLSNIFKKNSYNNLRFNIPNPDSTTAKTHLVYLCTKYWNSLPRVIRNASTLNSFNAKHKLHLLSN